MSFSACADINLQEQSDVCWTSGTAEWDYYWGELDPEDGPSLQRGQQLSQWYPLHLDCKTTGLRGFRGDLPAPGQWDCDEFLSLGSHAQPSAQSCVYPLWTDSWNRSDTGYSSRRSISTPARSEASGKNTKTALESSRDPQLLRDVAWSRTGAQDLTRLGVADDAFRTWFTPTHGLLNEKIGLAVPTSSWDDLPPLSAEPDKDECAGQASMAPIHNSLSEGSWSMSCLNNGTKDSDSLFNPITVVKQADLKHEFDSHRQSRPNECVTCGLSFSTGRSLKRHYTTTRHIRQLPELGLPTQHRKSRVPSEKHGRQADLAIQPDTYATRPSKPQTERTSPRPQSISVNKLPQSFALREFVTVGNDAMRQLDVLDIPYTAPGKPSKAVCTLCWRPFEEDAKAFKEHTEQHLDELRTSNSCQSCTANFLFRADLDCHLKVPGNGRCAFPFNDSCIDDDRDSSLQGSSQDAVSCRIDQRFHRYVVLLHWERLQIKAALESIESIRSIRPVMNSGSRAISCPPCARNRTVYSNDKRDPFLDQQNLTILEASGSTTDHPIPSNQEIPSEATGIDCGQGTYRQSGSEANRSDEVGLLFELSPSIKIRDSMEPAEVYAAIQDLKKRVQRMMLLIQPVTHVSPSLQTPSDPATPSSFDAEGNAVRRLEVHQHPSCGAVDSYPRRRNAPGRLRTRSQSLSLGLSTTLAADNIRARHSSEPPISRGFGLQNYTLGDIRSCTGESSTASQNAVPGEGSSQKSSGGAKRQHDGGSANGAEKGSDTGAGEDDGDRGGDGGPNRKRQRTETEGDMRKYSCIFYANEPQRYSKHTTEFKYISALIHHLKRSHAFFACSQCFTRFSDSATCESHGGTPCIKSCANKACRRYLPRGAVQPSHCACITNGHQQWHELFALAFHRQADCTQLLSLTPLTSWSAVPQSSAVENRQDLLPTDPCTSDIGLLDNDFGFPDYPWNTDEAPGVPDVPVSTIEGDSQTQGAVSQISFVPQRDQYSSRIEQELQTLRLHVVRLEERLEKHQQERFDLAEMQSLRQRNAILEQRLARPSRELRTAEATLRMLWEAFHSTGDARVQPESTLHGLVSAVLTPADMQPVNHSQALSRTPIVNVQSRPAIAAGQMEVPPPADNVIDPSTLVRLGKQPDRDAYYADSGYSTTYRTSQ